jgi:hypothetical protein
MGSEDRWFVSGLGVAALVAVAIAIFIPFKFVQLLVRDWRSRRKR